MAHNDDARRHYEWQNNLAAHQQATEEEQRRREHRAAHGDFGMDVIGGLILIVVLIVALVWLVRIAAITLIALLPIAAALWVCTKLLAEEEAENTGFLRALKASFIGLLAYVFFTTVIALTVSPLEMAAVDGWFARLVHAVMELRKQSLASLALVGPGKAQPAALMGLLGAEMQPPSMRISAVAALHGPGLLMFAFALNRYIGAPYSGVVGFLIACSLALVIVPACLGAVIWAFATH